MPNGMRVRTGFIPLLLVADPIVGFVPPFGGVDPDDLAEFLAGCP